MDIPYGEAIAYVDGSYSSKNRVPTYGLVFLTNGNENRFSGIVENTSLYPMHNVAGELEAVICAMNIVIYEASNNEKQTEVKRYLISEFL